MKTYRSLLFFGSLSLLLSGCGYFFTTESDGQEPEIIEEVDPVEDSIDNEPTVPEPEPEVEDTREVVSFYAVGDNLIHQAIINYAHQEDDTFDFKPIYENLADKIDEVDLAFINQESLVGGDDLGFSGYPSFNTPSDMIPNLIDLGFDIVIGSNNHTLDKGTSGVYNTIELWEEYEEDVLFTGIFNSQEHRDTIPVVEKNGMTFALLTYTYATNGLVPAEPYFVNYFDRDLITDDVARAQEMSDFIIVSAHWGDEHAFAPNAMQLEYAQLFADLGVDLVVGTHSHTIQPLEWLEGESGNDTLVIYSLGNLVAATISDINLLGGSVSLDFVKDEEQNEMYIENVQFEPNVIHYTLDIEGDIDSRSNFKIYPLANYSAELASEHALTGYEDNIISLENYQNMVDEVIPAEFLK